MTRDLYDYLEWLTNTHTRRWHLGHLPIGLAVEVMPASIEEQIPKYTGMQMRVSIPLPKPLFDNTSRSQEVIDRGKRNGCRKTKSD